MKWDGVVATRSLLFANWLIYFVSFSLIHLLVVKLLLLWLFKPSLVMPIHIDLFCCFCHFWFSLQNYGQKDTWTTMELNGLYVEQRIGRGHCTAGIRYWHFLVYVHSISFLCIVTHHLRNFCFPLQPEMGRKLVKLLLLLLFLHAFIFNLHLF